MAEEEGPSAASRGKGDTAALIGDGDANDPLTPLIELNDDDDSTDAGGDTEAEKLGIGGE